MNIAHDVKGHHVIDLEAVIDRSPQVIIASTGHGAAEGLPYEWASTELRLRNNEARKSNRIYRIDANLITRPGPRIVEGLEWMAHFIHPEIFPALK
jgi:iron complex transport system substrate-binding protein